MPVQMNVDPEKVKAPKPVAAAWYDLRLTGFKPKLAGKKDSVNFNAQLEVVSQKPEENGHKVYALLNTKMARQHADFAHGFGFPLNPDGSLPGDWIKDDKDPDNVEKYQYKGPLLGKIMHVELAVTSYQGNERNEIKQIKCKLPDCAVKFPDIKHTTNMIGGK
jgi:hypothetical protein